MGKLKKQKRSRKLATPYAKTDDADMAVDAGAAGDADMDATSAPAAPAPADRAAETLGKLKQRHHEEWKKIRLQIAAVNQKKRKLSNKDPAAIKQRKVLASEAQRLHADYCKRVEAETAACKRALAEAAAQKPAEESAPLKFDFGSEGPAAQMLAEVLAEQQRLREQVQRLESQLREKEGGQQ
eukprot:m51a1_g1839 hypothetical protein (183) ;mRNA; r:560993-561673